MVAAFVGAAFTQGWRGFRQPVALVHGHAECFPCVCVVGDLRCAVRNPPVEKLIRGRLERHFNLGSYQWYTTFDAPKRTTSNQSAHKKT